MNCEYCQSPVHVWFQCPKKPEGWKPARLIKFEVADYSPDVDGRAKLGKGKQSRHGPQFKSTDARKSEPPHTRGQPSARGKRDIVYAKAVGDIGSSPTQKAGVDVLPVDTNSGPLVKRQHSATNGNLTTSAGTVGNKDRQPKFDKKTWQRNYMRSFMAQYRADVKSGKRVPKKRG